MRDMLFIQRRINVEAMSSDVVLTLCGPQHPGTYSEQRLIRIGASLLLSSFAILALKTGLDRA